MAYLHRYWRNIKKNPDLKQVLPVGAPKAAARNFSLTRKGASVKGDQTIVLSREGTMITLAGSATGWWWWRNITEGAHC
jgi:hypothetical protein